MHILFFSILIGLALAMPVGPITITMSQRTLKYGYLQGILVGVGASTADVIYMLVLMLGMIHFLQNIILLRIIGCIGALVLCWFAYQAIVHHSKMNNKQVAKMSLWHCYTTGFLIAILSPFNILFWASMTAQLAHLTQGMHYGPLLAVIGLFIGLAIWFVSLNVTLHITRHRLSEVAITWLNRIGGVVLFLFALYSLWHVFYIG